MLRLAMHGTNIKLCVYLTVQASSSKHFFTFITVNPKGNKQN
jgi:hypothetical protein